jgi:D-alanine-D-alanine ligase
VTIVKDKAALEHAIEQAWRYDTRLLVEQFIGGREFTVGILDGAALPVVEIRTQRAFFDYEAKYNGDSEEICPAPLEPAQTEQLQQLALQAHQCLGCRDYSRVDILQDPSGGLWVLEVNTLPGLTPQSLLPKAAQAAGISMTELCRRLVELAAARRSCVTAAAA